VLSLPALGLLPVVAGIAGRLVPANGAAEAGKVLSGDAGKEPGKAFGDLLAQWLGPQQGTANAADGLSALAGLLPADAAGLPDLDALIAELEALFDGQPGTDPNDPLAGLLDAIAGLVDPPATLVALLNGAGGGPSGAAGATDPAALAAGLRALAETLGQPAPDLARRLAALADRLEADPADEALLQRLGLARTDAARTATADTTPTPPTGVEALLQKPEDRGFRKAETGLTPPVSPEAGDRRADDGPRPEPAARPVERPSPAADRDLHPVMPPAAAADAALADPAADAALPDPLAPLPVGSAQRSDAALPRLAMAPYQAAISQLAVPQLAFEIARQVAAGQSRFQIRLDPPELGRIDVRLEIDGKNGVHARLTVDKAETLDLLQRDHRSLERALAQAGLDAERTSLEFSLRQGGGGRQEGGEHLPRGFAGLSGDSDTDGKALPPPAITLYRGTASAGGIDRLA
jgi:flagellar hook-length control protein FliK